MPAPDLRFSSLVSLGSVVCGNIRTEFVQFSNEGSLEAPFAIQCEDDRCLKIAPAEGVLAPRGEEKKFCCLCLVHKEEKKQIFLLCC